MIGRSCNLTGLCRFLPLVEACSHLTCGGCRQLYARGTSNTNARRGRAWLAVREYLSNLQRRLLSFDLLPRRLPQKYFGERNGHRAGIDQICATCGSDRTVRCSRADLAKAPFPPPASGPRRCSDIGALLLRCGCRTQSGPFHLTAFFIAASRAFVAFSGDFVDCYEV